MTWLVIIILALLIPEILSTVLDSRLARAVAARLESGAGGGDRVTEERVRYLEAEVDRLSTDVRRLAEESEFLHRLLAERPPRRERERPPGEPDS